MSPEGSRVVSVDPAGVRVRELGRLESATIPGAEGAIEPFFSPDGRWVGFWQGGQLKKVAVTGGAPVALCAVAAAPSGATWDDDNTIWFGRGPNGIWQVSADGGSPTQVIAVEGHSANSPQRLPGRSRMVLFTLLKFGVLWDNAEIVTQDLDSGERRTLVAGGTDGRYLSTGDLLYVRGTTVFARLFDARALRVSGEPVPLVEGIAAPINVNNGGAAQFSVSRTGSFVYVPGALEAQKDLVWVDRAGREEATSAPPRGYTYPRLSPDGTRVAVPINNPGARVWIFDLRRSTLTRLTADPGTPAVGDNLGMMPVWSPDGHVIVFGANRSGQENLYRQAADGTGAVERLTTTSADQRPRAIAPDGRTLLLAERTDPTGPYWDLKTLSLDGDHASKPLIATKYTELNADLSADGRYVAYESDQSGRAEVYVQPFPDVEKGRWQVSVAGGTRPAWARNGRELFYVAPDGSMMAVTVQTQPIFSPA